MKFMLLLPICALVFVLALALTMTIKSDRSNIRQVQTRVIETCYDGIVYVSFFKRTIRSDMNTVVKINAETLQPETC